jgi:hypothetical protein
MLVNINGPLDKPEPVADSRRVLEMLLKFSGTCSFLPSPHKKSEQRIPQGGVSSYWFYWFYGLWDFQIVHVHISERYISF